jgi:hypothetical protein
MATFSVSVLLYATDAFYNFSLSPASKAGLPKKGQEAHLKASPR